MNEKRAGVWWVGWLTCSIAVVNSSCVEKRPDRAASVGSQRVLEVATTPDEPARSVPARNAQAPDATTHETAQQVRHAEKAGTWYPEDRAWAIAEMHQMARSARKAPSLAGKPIALIVPHAGWRYSGVAAAAAFRNLHYGEFDRVVLLGPSHRHAFAGFALPAFDAYETPLGRLPVCPEADALRDGKLVRELREADQGEHSLELELPWLQTMLGPVCIVPILVGQTDASSERALAAKLLPLHGDRTLFVISGDFVHYGRRFDYTPFGGSPTAAHDQIVALENRAIEHLTRRDAAGYRAFVDKTQATICGYHGQLVLLELLGLLPRKPEAVTLAHYSSADLAEERDESGSVGYVAMAYVSEKPAQTAPPIGAPARTPVCSDDAGLTQELGQQLLGLAKAALGTELNGTDALDRAFLSLPETPRFDCRQAVFVTLKTNGQLRGCVGQVEPEYPLAQAVVRSALDSALHDRRFEPVSAGELARLTFEWTALSVPREVPSYRDIVIGKHGIVMNAQGRRALFLPQVPGEQGWGLEATLRALSNKAGLEDDAWKGTDAKFSVFTGRVFEEHRTQPAPSVAPSTKGKHP